MTYGDKLKAAAESEKIYYVYMWFRKPDEGQKGLIPFYVGKGCGNRWRNKSGRSKTFSEFLKLHDCVSLIVANCLTDEIALIVEEKAKKELSKRGFSLLDAEHDMKERKCRQQEGISAMRIVNGKRISSKTGKCVGRPSREISDFEKIAKKQKDGLLTVTDACKELGISRTQWYREIKKQNNPPSTKSTDCPVDTTQKSADTKIVSRSL